MGRGAESGEASPPEDGAARSTSVKTLGLEGRVGQQERHARLGVLDLAAPGPADGVPKAEPERVHELVVVRVDVGVLEVAGEKIAIDSSE